MVSLSIIEFGVYGFITYSSILILLISTLQEEKRIKNTGTLVKAIFFLPAVVCSGILMTAEPDIHFDTVETLTITNNTVSTIFYEDTVTTDKISLVNPIWGSVHLILFFVLLLYVSTQLMKMLGLGQGKPVNSN